MKPPIKKILYYGSIILAGLVIVFLVCKAMLNLDGIGDAIRGMLGSLRPILFGCVMAYLLYPLSRFTEQFLLYHNVKKSAARSLSTAVSTAVLVALIFLFAYFVIPQLVLNLPALIQNLPGMIRSSIRELTDFLTSHGQSADILLDLSNRITDAFNAWLQDDPLSALMDLAGRVAAAAKGVLNFIIGIIVMVYLLMSRDKFVGQGKKILFAVCKKRTTCDIILKHLRAINQIFGGFVSGKLLDSLIIGILCGVCLSILQIPYTLIISVLVGITNIIPVFGPFFGAIPSAFLLLLTDPGKCLIFIIFIVILQQVDGNVIGPKILGDSTGLSAFWVLFALLLFNHIMGFWGMLLGVPLFASFYYLFREFINSRLKKKALPVATDEYIHISSIDNTGAISYNDPRTIEFHCLFKGTDSLWGRLCQRINRSLSKKPADSGNQETSDDDHSESNSPS